MHCLLWFFQFSFFCCWCFLFVIIASRFFLCNYCVYPFDGVTRQWLTLANIVYWVCSAFVLRPPSPNPCLFPICQPNPLYNLFTSFAQRVLVNIHMCIFIVSICVSVFMLFYTLTFRPFSPSLAHSLYHNALTKQIYLNKKSPISSMFANQLLK